MASPRRSPVSWCPPFALSLAMAGLGIGHTPDANADDVIRCRSGRLINVGMTAAEVRGLCGEPKSRVVEEVPIRAQGVRGANNRVIGTTRHERWTLDRGQGQFDALLHFESDKLVRIDLLNVR